MYRVFCIEQMYMSYLYKASLTMDGVESPARALMHLGIHQNREAMELGVWLIFKGVACG